MRPLRNGSVVFTVDSSGGEGGVSGLSDPGDLFGMGVNSRVDCVGDLGRHDRRRTPTVTSAAAGGGLFSAVPVVPAFFPD